MASIFNDINTDSKLAVLSGDMVIDHENTEIDFKRQLDLKDNAIKNVRDPTENKDAVNKEYVDITVSNAINGYEPGLHLYYTIPETNDKIAEATAPLGIDISSNYDAINVNKNSLTNAITDIDSSLNSIQDSLTNAIIDIDSSLNSIQDNLNTNNGEIDTINQILPTLVPMNSNNRIQAKSFVMNEQLEITPTLQAFTINDTQLPPKISTTVSYETNSKSQQPVGFSLGTTQGLNIFIQKDKTSIYNGEIQADYIQIVDGTIKREPVNYDDLVNKKYIDDKFTSNVVDIGGNYNGAYLNFNNDTYSSIGHNLNFKSGTTTYARIHTNMTGGDGDYFRYLGIGHSSVGDVGNDIVCNDGKVGIRTTQPTNTLDVNGGSIFRGDVDFKAHRLLNVATPTNNTDATNKAYVDTAISSFNVNSNIPTFKTVIPIKSGIRYSFQLPNFNGYVKLQDTTFAPDEEAVIYLPKQMCRQTIIWKNWNIINNFSNNKVFFGSPVSSYNFTLYNDFYGNFQVKYLESGSPFKNSWYIREVGLSEETFTRLTETSTMENPGIL